MGTIIACSRQQQQKKPFIFFMLCIAAITIVILDFYRFICRARATKHTFLQMIFRQIISIKYGNAGYCNVQKCISSIRQINKTDEMLQFLFICITISGQNMYRFIQIKRCLNMCHISIWNGCDGRLSQNNTCRKWQQQQQSSRCSSNCNYYFWL